MGTLPTERLQLLKDTAAWSQYQLMQAEMRQWLHITNWEWMGRKRPLHISVDIPASSLINKGKTISLFWPALEPAASRPLREYARYECKSHVVVKRVAILFRIWKSRFQVWVQSPAKLLVVSRGFRQPSVLSQMNPRPLPSTSSPVHYLLIILPFNAM
jgi:hypothetical protein